MRVVNADSLSHQNKSPEKCLLTAYKEIKCKYMEACIRQRHHFSLFTVSVDGLIGVEAESAPKRISICLATKWKQT